ncbi:hypothetical protein Tco_1005324 [Tanacetum coccineum]|uniref:Uncharacterized protein n=1 Tax=Tanacetum coccineum TaxID=301880 RepID=A0ABQ5FEE1_9ASTR
MNQEQIQQAACDEALVPTTDRVKISTTNMRIDPTLTQKEETYQVILDIIKTSPCYNAFLITANVPEIYMQQFWFTVKKVKKSSFYQFDLADKKCQVDGMFHKKNVDFAELIWEDFQYQIEFRQSKLRRREIMPYLRFTKIIINYFLSQYKSISKRQGSYVNTIKDDGVLGRLKFVSKGKDYQVYGLDIPDTMLNEEIKNSEPYQTFLALSTCLIPPKKSRGKGSKGKKETITPKKKGSIIVDDNTILEPNVAPELGKSINITKAEIVDKARRVHEIHERLSTGLSEGAGIIPEVLDESKGSYVAKVVAEIDWSQSDDEHVNEGEIEWPSSNDEEKVKDDDEDDMDEDDD